MNLSLRAAVTDDLPAVHGLYRQLYDELDLRLDDRVRRAWDDTVRTPGRTVLLAVVSDAVVGTLDMTIVPNAARAGRPLLLVENVVVDAAHRGRGIGRAMLEAAFAHARSEGCYKVQLSPVQPSAFAFYEAVGMEVSGRTYKRYLDD